MDENLIKSMNSLDKIEMNYKNNSLFLKEKDKEKIQNLEIYKKITELTPDIQKKIYIFAMKKYWKKNFLETNLYPFWMDYQFYLNNQYKKVFFENVHFMHLEFNTLPENKEYIMGCQCDFCKEYFMKNHKKIKYFLTEEEFIKDNLKLSEYYDFNMNYWNRFIVNGFKVYDHLYELTDNNGYIDLSFYSD